MKVLVVFGTRPEAIKMAPLVKELLKHKEINCCVCITAQHREMLDQVLSAFEITADYDLDIMEHEQSLATITTKALLKIGEVVREVKPDIVLVHGDTTTAYAGALAAFYERIPVGHVEAGLRTGNIYSPFPEEMNRQMIDTLASVYFAPTQQSRQNLLQENRRNESIYVTGNTAIDALKTTVSPHYAHPLLEWCKGSRLILLTAHRRENLGEPLTRILRAVKRITIEHEDVKVVYPVHLNPLIRQCAQRELGDTTRIKLVEPLDVVDFHNLMNEAFLILTDSGGIQEEAPSLGKPVLVLRDTTERPEGILSGTLKLVGTHEDEIGKSVTELLLEGDLYKSMSKAQNPYGDGHASERIVSALVEMFS